MNRSTKAASNPPSCAGKTACALRRTRPARNRGRASKRGFTLLEVMVAVAVLAVAIVPMLVLREDSYNKAIETKTLRTAQQLARQVLSHIALNVRVDEGSDTFEDWPDFRYEYNVTLYDFNKGLEDDSYRDRENQPAFGYEPDDSFLPDDEEELTRDSNSMTMRHVELKIIYPKYLEGGDIEECEYIIDTYLPMLMTERQYEFQMKQQEEQASKGDE